MINPTQVLVSGPLAEFGPGYASELLRQGYKTNPAGVQMNLMAHLNRWLAAEGLDVHRLSDTEVERYLRARRAAGWVNHCGSRAMQPRNVSMEMRHWFDLISVETQPPFGPNSHLQAD